jgi:hypothetical protein
MTLQTAQQHISVTGREEPPMAPAVKGVRRLRLDSEQGLLLMVGILVLLGATAIMAVSGW